MPDDVKGTRTYRSAVREEQAARTRARILAAAGDLFAAEGYAGTSVKAIAGRAEVAADTVYATFGTKVRIVTALIDAQLAPAGEGNVTETDSAQQIRDEPDPRRQIHLFARWMAGTVTRVGPVHGILRAAAAVEAEAATVLAEMEGHRLENMRRFVGWIEARGVLRVDADRAAEIVWAMASPQLTHLLRDVRGWGVDEHADWLEDTLAHALLP